MISKSAYVIADRWRRTKSNTAIDIEDVDGDVVSRCEIRREERRNNLKLWELGRNGRTKDKNR
jgi:hypothetical protein